jgi:F-type H+-transporting ATPase subunit gamma
LRRCCRHQIPADLTQRLVHRHELSAERHSRFPPRRSAVIVFGSNQGLCGPVNRQVARHAAEVVAACPTSVFEVVAVGFRLSSELELTGVPPDVVLELPNSVDGISPRAAELLVRIDRWRRADPNPAVHLVFPSFRGRHAGFEPADRPLLPFDTARLRELVGQPWPGRSLPTYTVGRTELLATLVRQSVFAGLTRTFAQAMASVAASRLVAMDNAQRDVEERLAELHRERHRLRQAAVTEELLDVISGFEAMRE